jgi:hypothetical protein
MKPLAKASFVSVALLLCLPFAAKGQNRSERLRAEIKAAPTMTYCDLLFKSSDYDGKVVRVRGIYKVGFENSDLSSPECDLGFLNTWVTFDSEFDKLTERKWRGKLQKSDGVQGLDVVFVGRFKEAGSGAWSGFGHQNMYSYQLDVLTAESVQPLGTFGPLPNSLASRLARNPTPISLCAAQTKPEANNNGEPTLIFATLSVLKELSNLHADECPREGALAEFSPNWRAVTEPRIAKTIDTLRRESNTKWPYRGITAIEFTFKSADVVVEGTLMPNPGYIDTSIVPETDLARLLAASDFRTWPKLLFRVQRVISAKEAKR